MERHISLARKLLVLDALEVWLTCKSWEVVLDSKMQSLSGIHLAWSAEHSSYDLVCSSAKQAHKYANSKLLGANSREDWGIWWPFFLWFSGSLKAAVFIGRKSLELHGENKTCQEGHQPCFAQCFFWRPSLRRVSKPLPSPSGGFLEKLLSEWALIHVSKPVLTLIMSVLSSSTLTESGIWRAQSHTPVAQQPSQKPWNPEHATAFDIWALWFWRG